MGVTQEAKRILVSRLPDRRVYYIGFPEDSGRRIRGLPATLRYFDRLGSLVEGSFEQPPNYREVPEREKDLFEDLRLSRITSKI